MQYTVLCCVCDTELLCRPALGGSSVARKPLGGGGKPLAANPLGGAFARRSAPSKPLHQNAGRVARVSAPAGIAPGGKENDGSVAGAFFVLPLYSQST